MPRNVRFTGTGAGRLETTREGWTRLASGRQRGEAPVSSTEVPVWKFSADMVERDTNELLYRAEIRYEVNRGIYVVDYVRLDGTISGSSSSQAR